MSVDSLTVSQVLSLEAPQSETDKLDQAQNINQNAQLTSGVLFKAFLDEWMHSVHQTLATEKEDPLSKEEDKEHSDSEESKQ